MSYRSRASIRLIGNDNSIAPSARLRSSGGGYIRSGKIEPLQIRSRRSAWARPMRYVALAAVITLVLFDVWHGRMMPPL